MTLSIIVLGLLVLGLGLCVVVLLLACLGYQKRVKEMEALVVQAVEVTQRQVTAATARADVRVDSAIGGALSARLVAREPKRPQ